MIFDKSLHRQKMFQIITDIYKSPLAHKLGFKGGTLAYFMYQLDRFSTDLDFDLLDPLIGDKILDEVSKIISKYGNIKDIHSKRFTYFLLLDYGAHHKNIKFDISKKKHKLDTYETLNFFGTPILAMKQESMFANKLLALHTRWKNRDLYDVRFFFEHHFPLDKNIIETKSGMHYEQFLDFLQQELPKHYSTKTLLAEIGDLVTEKQKYFIKHELLDAVMSWLAFEKDSEKKENNV